MSMRGHTHTQKEEFDIATQYFQVSAAMFGLLRDWTQYGTAMNNLTSVAYSIEKAKPEEKRNFDQAIRIGEEGLRALRGASYLVPAAPLAQTMCAIFDAKKDQQKAKEFAEEALDLAERIGNKRIDIDSDYSLGTFEGKHHRWARQKRVARKVQDYKFLPPELEKAALEDFSDDIEQWIEFAEEIGIDKRKLQILIAKHFLQTLYSASSRDKK
jgi:hypothetical protein